MHSLREFRPQNCLAYAFLGKALGYLILLFYRSSKRTTRIIVRRCQAMTTMRRPPMGTWRGKSRPASVYAPSPRSAALAVLHLPYNQSKACSLKRIYYAAGLTIFVLAPFACAFAPTLPMLMRRSGTASEMMLRLATSGGRSVVRLRRGPSCVTGGNSRSV